MARNISLVWGLLRLTPTITDSFVNPPPLPWLFEISGAIHLAQAGLMGGRWQIKLRQNSKFIKLISDRVIRLFAMFNKQTNGIITTVEFKLFF